MSWEKTMTWYGNLNILKILQKNENYIEYLRTKKRNKARQVALAAKPDHLNSVPTAYMMGGENWLPKLPPDVPMCATACGITYTD